LKEETDPAKYFVCPIRWFLSMAVKDKVFVERVDAKYFEDRWIREGTNSRTIRIADDKKSLPILRKLDGTKISADRIMGAVSVSKYLKLLSERAGYKDTVTCYSFRRGFANALEGE
jgi:hypothetical protein